MDQKPNIFDFTDYRLYLHKYCEFKKSQNKQWSYQAWALKIGLKNNTSILKILNGQREAGKAIQSKLFKYFNFNSEEEKYFIQLVNLSKSKGDLAKSAEIRRVLKKDFNVSLRKTVDEKIFATLSNWINMVIRQSYRIKKFKFTTNDLKANLLFDLPLFKIEEALNNLISLGMIEINKTGTKISWDRKDVDIKTTNDVVSKSIQDYHKNVLSLASSALSLVDVKKREFSSSVLAIEESQIAEAKIFLRNFEEDFCNKFEVKNNTADEIYVFNIQLFPLTKFNSRGNHEE